MRPIWISWSTTPVSAATGKRDHLQPNCRHTIGARLQGAVGGAGDKCEYGDRSVIVTGARRGVGRGIAKVLAAEGAKVMLGADSLSFAEDAREAIRAAGGTAEVAGLDVKDHASCAALIDATLAAFRGIDSVIHCAAEIPLGGVGDVVQATITAPLTKSPSTAISGKQGQSPTTRHCLQRS